MLDKNLTVFANNEKSIKNIINLLSDKEKKYITLRTFDQKIHLGVVEIQSILDRMVDRGELQREFVIQCPNCKSDIFITGFDKNGYVCEECDNKFIGDIKSLLIDIIYSVVDVAKSSDGIDYNKYFTTDRCKEKATVIKLEDKIKKICKGESVEGMEKKIFISHNESDKELANAVIDLLEDIGVNCEGKNGQLFCSSSLGRGVGIGQDIFQRIKNEFNDDIIVLFLFTENFFKSPACMCEMGATWVTSKAFVPLVLSPMKFEHINGIINTNIKGFDLQNYEKISEFIEFICNEFKLEEPGMTRFERIKNKYIKNIETYTKMN